MKLIIEIPEELYKTYKGRPPMLGDTGMDMIAQSIANGTPSEQEPCDDCVSRRAAIDAMQALQDEDVETYGVLIPECFDSERAIEALKQLKPVRLTEKAEQESKTSCDKCVYSTKNGECQYDDIVETIPTEQEPKTDVLDKIRAEIADSAKRCMNDTRAEGIYMALKIIDKYKAEQGGE